MAAWIERAEPGEAPIVPSMTTNKATVARTVFGLGTVWLATGHSASKSRLVPSRRAAGVLGVPANRHARMPVYVDGWYIGARRSRRHLSFRLRSQSRKTKELGGASGAREQSGPWAWKTSISYRPSDPRLIAKRKKKKKKKSSRNRSFLWQLQLATTAPTDQNRRAPLEPLCACTPSS